MKIGTIVAAIAGGIVMFLLGGLVFGVLLADYFRANSIEYAGLVKDPFETWALVAFNLAWASLIAFALDYAGRRGWAEGAKAGAIVMFLVSAGTNLEYHAFMNVNKELAPVLVQMLIVTIMGAISGAVIGLVMGLFDRGSVQEA